MKAKQAKIIAEEYLADRVNFKKTDEFLKEVYANILKKAKVGEFSTHIDLPEYMFNSYSYERGGRLSRVADKSVPNKFYIKLEQELLREGYTVGHSAYPLHPSVLIIAWKFIGESTI